MRRIAYLFPLFPVINQTFTLAEVVWLKRQGYDIRIISLLSRVAETQQPEGQRLIAETFYCPRSLSKEVLGALARGLAKDARGVLRLFGVVVKAWREKPPDRGSSDRSGPKTFTFAEWVDLLYRASPYTYLLKSLMMVPYAMYLSEYLTREGIGHVHCHWATYPATVGMLMKEWAGIPYSVAAHAYDIYMHPRMLRAKVTNASFVVTCADYNRRFLASLVEPEAASRIYLNYHGTDLGRFQPVERRPGKGLNVVSAGWLKEYKGFHILVEAVAELVGRGVDVVFHLAGDGPQRDYLQKQAARLGVEGRVVFYGYVDHERLAELYGACDVFAIGSLALSSFGRQDVIPNVLAEAMASEMPVVATRMGGIPELVEDGVDGILVPPRDARAMADALEKIWRDPDGASRLARAGREKVERIWDREKNLRQLAALLDEKVAPVDGSPAAS